MLMSSRYPDTPRVRQRRLDRLYYWAGIMLATVAMVAMVPITWMMASSL